jgi:hypothetical protein
MKLLDKNGLERFHSSWTRSKAKCRDKRRQRRRAVLAASKPPASNLWFWLILLFVVCEEAGKKLAATVGTKPKAKALTPEI